MRPLIFVNGWAMPDSILAPIISALKQPVIIINLSDLWSLSDKKANECQLHDLIFLMHRLLPDEPVSLVGWSYGGVLAGAYAGAFPKKVASLVLLAANPCFVAKKSWSTAMDSATFNHFAIQLRKLPEKALAQFSTLCAMGNQQPKALRKKLFAVLKNNESLVPLLAVLGAADIRSQLASLRCPVTYCYGDNDALVPSGLIAVMKAYYKEHRVQLYSGGHCFFLDNPESVITLLKHHC